MKCVSADDIQTMSHIVDSCPLTKLGGLQRLHAADKAAVDWLTSIYGTQKHTKHYTVPNSTQLAIEQR